MARRRVYIDDLIDARQLADLLGLQLRNSVTMYVRTHPDMPKPVLELGPGRPKLWLRSEVERWLEREEGQR